MDAREDRFDFSGEAANSTTAMEARYLSTRQAVVYLGLGEDPKDGVPAVGSTYERRGRIVTLMMRVGTRGALSGGNPHSRRWVDLARLGTPEFPLVKAADPLDAGLQRLEKWRAQGKGPRFHKLGNARGDEVFYARADLDEWMERHRREHRRAG
jgi:hypothetical protein